MSILFVTMSLFGCDKNPEKPDSELTSISISQSHMDRTYCYNFFVRKENGLYLFDADCVFVDNDEHCEVNFTDKVIAQEEFEEFAKLDEKYGFLSLIKPKKEKKSIFFALDETITHFTVKYGEDAFSLYPNGECYSKVSENFFALAEKYNKTKIKAK